VFAIEMSLAMMLSVSEPQADAKIGPFIHRTFRHVQAERVKKLSS